MHDWAAAAALPPISAALPKNRQFNWARAIGSAHPPASRRMSAKILPQLKPHQKLVAEKSEFADAAEDDRKEAQAWLAFGRRQG